MREPDLEEEEWGVLLSPQPPVPSAVEMEPQRQVAVDASALLV